MGNYVKVKKAKVLRFQLISVMYLLFISLSILQIPIDWLRTNVNVANYINRSTKVEMDVPIVLSTYQELEKIEKDFFKLAVRTNFNCRRKPNPKTFCHQIAHRLPTFDDKA